MQSIRRCLFLCLLGCLPAKGLQAEPAVWRVTHAGTTDYLIGSIHLLPAGEAMPASYERAYERTQALIFETDMQAVLDPSTQMRLMAGAGLDEAGGLEAIVPASLYRRLGERFAALGLPIEIVQPFEPWFAAVTLESLGYLRAGFSAQHGVEHWFHQRALAGARLIGWYETATEQTELFTRMPREMAIRLLETTLDQQTARAQPADELLAIWRNGDLHALNALLDAFRREAPDLYQRLLAERNRRWLPTLQVQLRDDTAQLIVVGLAHFAGPDGLLTLLRDRGYTVERLR